jgi:hypothetical protein
MTNSRKNEKIFSATEVGTLVEGLRTDIRAVAEAVAPIPERLTAVEVRLGVVETEVRSLKDVVRVAVPSINVRLSNLEAKVGV